MKLLLNKQRLLHVMQDFHTMSNIRINISDYFSKEILAFPSSISKYCQYLQSGPFGNSLCLKCDRNALTKAQASSQDVYIYTCHAGLLEVISTIRIEDEVLGYMMFGQLRVRTPYEHKTWSQVYSLASTLISPYIISESELKHAYFDLPSATPEWINATANIMRIVLTYVQLDEQIRIQSEPFSLRVEKYIKSNLDKTLNIPILSQKMMVGKTTLCTKTKQYFNCSVNELIRNLRIKEAQRLLHMSDMPIYQVAEKCGFHDYNYFSKIFKSELGVTPSQYRRLCQNQL